MRRALPALIASAALAAVALPSAAHAQMSQRQTEQRDAENQRARERAPGRLDARANAGPCPYVKILYDAARYVELPAGQASAAAVGFTGEIEGLSSNCRYRGDDPVVVDMDILFRLGRGPQASGDSQTYRYWIAVTERNSAILTKEYFDLPVSFDGADRTTVTEQIRGLTIPRANSDVSGSNFEILIGFDVTPQMAEFNRSGSRFRINAGQPQGQ